MKKWFGQFLLLSAAGIAILCASCTKQDQYPDNLLLVPKDVAAVVCFDVKSLIKKADAVTFKNMSFYKNFRQDALSDQPALKALLTDPSKSGIDFKEAFFFLNEKDEGGVTFALKNSSDFEKALVDLSKSDNKPANIKSVAGCKYISLSNGTVDSSATVVIWNNDVALVSLNQPKEKALQLFANKEEQSILAEKDFTDFYQNRKDISAWVKMGSIYKIMANSRLYASRISSAPPVTDSALVKALRYHFYMDFKAGEVDFTCDGAPIDIAKKYYAAYYKSNFNNELLNSFPANTFLVMKAALNVPAIMKLLSQDPQFSSSITPDVQKIINSLDGDFAISLFNFADGGMPIPQIAAAVTVKDKTVYDAIMQNLSQGTVKTELNGYTSISTGGIFSIFIAQKGNMLFASNSEEVVKSFAAGKKPEGGSLLSSPLKDLKESPTYFYFNLDPDAYPSSVLAFLNNVGDKDNIRKALFFKDITVAYDPQTTICPITLRLKDTKQNSLATIIQKIDEISSQK